MQGVLGVGLEWMMCLTELIIFHVWMGKQCEKRGRGQLSRIFILIGVTTLLYIKSYWEIFDFIGGFLCVGILSAYGIAVFKSKGHMYLVYGGLYVLLVSLSDTICISIAVILCPGIGIEDLLKVDSMRYIVGIISKILVSYLVLRMSYKDKQQSKKYSKANLEMMLMIFMISMICLYSLFAVRHRHYDGDSNKQMDGLVCLISLSILLIDMISYWAIKQLNITWVKEKEYELIQYQNEWLNKTIIEYKQVENEWRKNRHDFNNHISCIDMLLQMENIPKARKYIHNLTDHWQKNDLSIHIGNEITDAVLNQKAVQAKNLKIDFLVFGQIDERVTIEDMDLCALLSNGLDNAIEAAKQVPETRDRKIEIVFTSQSERAIIRIKNSVIENIDYKRPLVTTKKDKKRHGIGMMSMHNAVSKYGGIIEWQCQDYEFQLTIELPV